MTSINFVKEIQKRKARLSTGEKGSTASFGSPLMEKLKNMGLSASDNAGFEPKDKILLVLFLLGIASIPGARYYVENYVTKPEEDRMRNQKVQVEQQIATEVQKIKAFDSVKQEIASFELKMDELRKKLALIENVQKNRNSIVRMVDFVITEMPENVWLGEIKIETKVLGTVGTTNTGQPGAPPLPPGTPAPPATPSTPPSAQAAAVPNSFGKVDILGKATSMQLVSEFVKRLEGAVFFPKWNLQETTTELLPTLAPVAGAPTAAPRESKGFKIDAQVMSL